jgi:hypothetical protein
VKERRKKKGEKKEEEENKQTNKEKNIKGSVIKAVRDSRVLRIILAMEKVGS